MFAPLVAKAQKADASPTNKLRLLSQRTRNLNENDPHGHNEQQAVPTSLTAQETTPGVSWDFSKIPLFPPARADRPQPPSPIAATRLPGAIQAKLVVGQVNDPLEHEADRVADQVMRMAEPAPIGKARATLQRMCATCEEDKQKAEPLAQSVEGGEDELPSGTQTLVFRKAAFAAPPADTRSPAPVADRVLARRGGGEPLQVQTRQRMEDAFGRDFSRVRVHHDAEANRMSQQLGALAFTHGSDIYFGSSMLDPRGSSGARLLAHELTHVAQQGRAGLRDRGDISGPVAARQGMSVMSDRGPDQTIRRVATWVGGPVNEVNNLANAVLNGAPVGITKPVLNCNSSNLI